MFFIIFLKFSSLNDVGRAIVPTEPYRSQAHRNRACVMWRRLPFPVLVSGCHSIVLILNNSCLQQTKGWKEQTPCCIFFFFSFPLLLHKFTCRT
uniref:Secreted protein n=1 Tax=Arundo donax TaxID=35708 RepID=A0A0A9CHB5_ARUDO